MMRWLSVLVLVCSVALVAPGAMAQGNDPVRVKVVTDFVVVREGRGDGTPLVAQLPGGSVVPSIGNQSTDGWWQVQLPDGRQGWVNGGKEYVQILGPAVAEKLPPATPTGMLVFQTSSGGAIYTINADGSNLRHLTNGLDPALSPDRQWVAFTRWDFPWGLYVIRTDGTGEREVFGQQEVKAPAWSPDGTQIAFSFQHGGHISSWTATITRQLPGRNGQPGKTVTLSRPMPADERWKIGVVRLSDDYFHEMYSQDYSYSPTWSPDGKRIAYASDRGISLTWDGITSAATRDPNTYAVSTFWSVDRSPVWSPDGTRIVFQYKTSDHSEIFVMNADGSGRTALTQSPSLFINSTSMSNAPISSVAPAWSPDGTQIAYLTNPNGVWDIWVMNADGANPHPLFKPGTLKNVTFEYENVDERVLSWR